MAKLILLDIDGTIADRNSTTVYPEALDFFTRTSADIAFVTNQGGPACHDAGWDFSDRFPSLEQVEERLSATLASIPFSDNYGMYVSYAYKQKNGVIIVPKSDKFDFRPAPPKPGASLSQACSSRRWQIGRYCLTSA